MNKKFNEDSVLSDILKFPEAIEILKEFNLPCLNCPMATYEIQSLKIGQVAKTYDIDIDSLLKKLNEI